MAIDTSCFATAYANIKRQHDIQLAHAKSTSAMINQMLTTPTCVSEFSSEQAAYAAAVKAQSDANVVALTAIAKV